MAWLSPLARLSCLQQWHSAITRALVVALTVLCGPLVTCGQSTTEFAKDFGKAVWSWETPFVPGATAAFSNYIYPKNTDYGTGIGGYGHRYGVSLADNVNSKLMRKFVFAEVARREDVYCEIGSLHRLWPNRVLNAVGHSLFKVPQVDHSLSRSSFNWSSLPASFAAAALSNVYQPKTERGWGATGVRFGWNALGYATGDVWDEITYKPAGVTPILSSRVTGMISVLRTARVVLKPR